jgi:hypothetical protein
MARRKDLPPIKTEKQKAEEDRVRWLSYAPDIAKFFRASFVENNGRMARAELLQKLENYSPDLRDAIGFIDLGSSNVARDKPWYGAFLRAKDKVYGDLRVSSDKSGITYYSLIESETPLTSPSA